MSRDKDFGVIVTERAGGLTLAELEERLHAEGHDQDTIDYTLWLIAVCREDLRLRGGVQHSIVQ